MLRPTIYEAAGGAGAFLALARAHHGRCLADPVLNHPFSHGTHPEHVEHLASYWAEVFGGPPSYSDSVQDQTAMLSLHSETGAEDDLGERFLECFIKAIDVAQLPEDAELRAALRGYMTWAVGDVMSYAPHGSRVRPGLRVPRWGWEGLESDDPQRSLKLCLADS